MPTRRPPFYSIVYGQFRNSFTRKFLHHASAQSSETLVLTADGEKSKSPKHTKLRFLLATLKYMLAYKVTGREEGTGVPVPVPEPARQVRQVPDQC